MRARGFTLLEIMVAVAILGLALTAILSAQAGLFSAGTHAQREAQAIGLLRCKMGEIEERLLRLGYPEVDTKDEGVCCDDSSAANEGMRCEFNIQRVELPQPPTFSDTATVDGGAALSLLTSGMDGGLGSMPMGLGAMGAQGGGSMPGLPGGGGLGPLGGLLNATSNDAGALVAAGGADGGFQALSSMMGGATSGGVGGLAPMVMSIVYPSLKPMLEASIRKITITVYWNEGLRKRDLAIVQYVTNPMRGGFLGGPMASGMPSGMPGPQSFGATGAGDTTGGAMPGLGTPATGVMGGPTRSLFGGGSPK
jgi:general secretion pathway protein I